MFYRATWAILCTDGQMNLNEVRNECIPGKWVPLFVYRTKETDTPIIPLFFDEITARKFIKRNLPKSWTHGGVNLTDADIGWIKEKGWIIREMTYPNLVTHFQMGFEILEFAEQPSFKIR